MTRLKQMAAQTTHFVGNISDEALRDLYAHALVTLCPGIDDFGLTAVESMAAGTPAIVHSSSGNAEAVLDSETGYCVELAGPHELADAVVRTQERQWSRTKCQRRAKEFDIAACISQWKELV
jgi:alpha-1,6-mannosyltransferase